MIERRTVLILGAGASAPYGFPVGEALLQEVVQRTKKPAHDLFLYLGTAFKTEEITSFRDALNLSMQPSIDAFLENRTEFMEIGKHAIAATLIPYENEDELDRRTPNHWYKYLFTRMAPTLEDFAQSRLSIVTFNYDRSFEHFFYLALTRSFHLSDEDFKEAMKGIQIVHVYGQLGGLPYATGTGRAYRPESERQKIREAAQQIRVLPEAVKGDQIFDQARHLVATAEVICFLGFGFHRTNLERLGIPHVTQEKRDVFASAFGLTPTEVHTVRGFFRRNLVFGDTDQDALRFLRNHPVLSP